MFFKREFNVSFGVLAILVNGEILEVGSSGGNWDGLHYWVVVWMLEGVGVDSYMEYKVF